MNSISLERCTDDDDDDVLDYRETPLNACSLETFCGPKNIDQDSEDRPIPLCLGCYQLNESTGNREGRLDLYAVPVGDKNKHQNKKGGIESFGALPPLTIFGGDGDGEIPAPGVLDGKWSNHPRYDASGGGFQNYYATAHANGEIWVHEIRSNSNNPQQTAFEAGLAGKAASPSSNEGLCLALAWESPLYGTDENDCTNNSIFDTRIISSYSDGHTAIHRVRGQQPLNETIGKSAALELELEHHWDSHKIFTCPAEVWCANFIDTNTVVTGGDEGSWKVWDLRQPLTGKPVYHGKDDFGAGVTVLAPHPKNPRLLAVGSYDETVAVFDLRKSVGCSSSSSNRRPDELYHSNSLGGGIWRCKWHPFDHNKLLVAAMHGGCVVGGFEGLYGTNGEERSEFSKVGFRIQKEFKLHKSMAYGIDWLSSSSGIETAASCSFYDKAMYLWNTGSS